MALSVRQEKFGMRLSALFTTIKPKRILVAGDFILDRYTWGSCKRISPEAPVPVISVTREEHKAGGAGNVILNLLSLGMHVHALGRVGVDAAGTSLLDALAEEGVDTRGLLQEPDFQTPVKNRLIAGAQQITRIDYETPKSISADLEKRFLREIPKLLESIDLVAISDYAKGFLTNKVLAALIQTAKKLKIPVISDPKGVDFSKYAGSTLLKPNLSEAFQAAPESKTLLDAAKVIFSKVSVDTLMVTRSEAGISLFYPDGRQEDHSVEAKEVKDVTGAGDTVLAVLACAMANKISVSEATELANIAGQVAVSRIGCVRVSLSEIARSMVERYTHSKIFDEAHFPTLKQVLRPEEFVLVTLDAGSELSSKVFKAIRASVEKTNHELLVAVFGSGPDEELVTALASHRFVNYVLLTGSDPQKLLSELLPCKTVKI